MRSGASSCAPRRSPAWQKEAGFACKDLSEAVDTPCRLDLSRPVVSLTPIGNIKG
jgi:hypothetical protein